MLNRHYLKYISSIDDDLKCLLDFKDEDVLNHCTVSFEDFEAYISPDLHGLDVEALYCLCVYVMHLLSHNKVWATQNSMCDDYLELMSKLRNKSVCKISFWHVENGVKKQIPLTNKVIVQNIIQQLEAYGKLVESPQFDVFEVEASAYLNTGSVRDMVLLIMTKLIEHEYGGKITPQYKKLVVKILFLFKLREEYDPKSVLDNYCEREVYDNIRSKIKPIKWFPVPNNKDNPYPSPQQIETHDRLKGRKIPRKSPKRASKGCIES